jgi:hypothetical protein
LRRVSGFGHDRGRPYSMSELSGAETVTPNFELETSLKCRTAYYAVHAPWNKSLTGSSTQPGTS